MSPLGEDWAAGLFDDEFVDRPGPEPLDEGGTHLLDLVAAVDYLNRGIRPDFTVWDALEEALTWWLTDHTDQPIDIPESGLDDPLRHRLTQLLDNAPAGEDSTFAHALQQALRHWTTVTADRFNNGHHWPHPVGRRTFPPRRMATPPA
jgi:hypothetical protein